MELDDLIELIYLGAMLFKHLKTVRFTSLIINPSIVFQPKL